mmetsp:Transcript_8963/g.39458  ORF Transcript_8963/g.39458 Transcript_8963/m.39458 type:complete len:320 (+) Transcript_8963:67-1026(+)
MTSTAARFLAGSFRSFTPSRATFALNRASSRIGAHIRGAQFSAMASFGPEPPPAKKAKENSWDKNGDTFDKVASSAAAERNRQPIADVVVPLLAHLDCGLVVELACGTGRFLTFARDNYPKMDVTGLELSPFYLAEARKNGAYWEKLRRRKQSSPVGLVTETLSRVGGLAKAAGLPVPPVPSARRDDVQDEAGKETLGSCEYVQAQAEKMPFPDASFDAITCVYLLHELPPEARREVAKEAARVLRPGGVLILADSIQLGDRPRMDKNLGRFGDFNEPYYRSYIEEALVEVFGPEGAGLEPWTKDLCSSTKVLSFRKPE